MTITLQGTPEVNVIVITSDVTKGVTIEIVIIEYNHCRLPPVSLLFRQQCRPNMLLAFMPIVTMLVCIQTSLHVTSKCVL